MPRRRGEPGRGRTSLTIAGPRGMADRPAALRAKRRRATRAVAGLLTAMGWLLGGTPVLAQERVEGNLYTNTRYGIEIAKPPGWHFITAGMILDLARKQAGQGRPKADDDPVKVAGFAVVVSNVPALGRGFDPQAIVLVHELPQAPADLVATCEEYRSGMTEPETVRPTRLVQLGGQPAARLDFQGLVDGAPVRATALCAVRDRRAYVVVAQALAAEFDASARAFEAILASFRLR